MVERYSTHTIAKGVYVPAEEAIRVTGSLIVDSDPGANGTMDQVAVSALSGTAPEVLAADTTREEGLLLLNESGEVIYISFSGFTAVDDNCIPLEDGSVAELPSTKAIHAATGVGGGTVKLSYISM